MKKTLKFIGSILITLAFLDLLILFGSLGQIGIEGRTGEWNQFWEFQARAVISLLK